MKFRGVDINTIHPVVRLSKETPPGVEYEVATVEGRNRETYAGTVKRRNEYRVTVNIAARTNEQMMRARAALAAWAAGGVGVLEPTHWPGMAYDAVLESIDAPEKRFTALEVVFVLPNAVAYELRTSAAAGTGKLNMRVGGTAEAHPVIRQTISEARTGVTWEKDGETLLKYNGELAAGDVIAMDLKQGSLTVNGEHMEDQLDYTATDYEMPFQPGKNNITSNDGGSMEGRWHNEWL